MKILLVEDQQYVADGLIRALVRNSHTVKWATKLAQARNLLEENEFDLAILDYDLGMGAKGPDLLPDLDARGIPAVLHSGIPREDVYIPQIPKGARLEIMDYVEEFANGQ